MILKLRNGCLFVWQITLCEKVGKIENPYESKWKLRKL